MPFTSYLDPLYPVVNFLFVISVTETSDILGVFDAQHTALQTAEAAAHFVDLTIFPGC